MRVSWITFSEAYRDRSGNLTSDLASLRYRVIAAARGIQECDYTVAIIPVRSPATEAKIVAAESSDVVIFSKSFLATNEELLRRVKSKGAVTIFDVCDNHYDHPEHGQHYRAMSANVDQVVCNTEQMAIAARPYCERPPIVIHDPYEGPRGEFAGLSDNPKLLWFGHPTNLDSLHSCLEDLVGYARYRPLTLSVLTQPVPKFEAIAQAISQRHAPYFHIACQRWSLDAQWEALAVCDAVIIPSLQNDRKKVKSANRMIEGLWAGKPVVAQPMPAYAPFAEWTPIKPLISQGLAQLMMERNEIGPRIGAAQAFIDEHYSPAEIGEHWKQLIGQQIQNRVRHEA